LGQRPKAPCKFGLCCLVERFLFSAEGVNGFPTAQSAIRGRSQLFVGFNSFSQFDHSCQEEERAAQSNYRSVFHPSRWPELAPFQSFIVKIKSKFPPSFLLRFHTEA
jgi:hypothetical protein